MGPSGYIGIGKVIIGAVSGNPVLVLSGAKQTLTSIALGTVLSPITEPMKEAAGSFYEGVDWGDVVDNCPFW